MSTLIDVRVNCVLGLFPFRSGLFPQSSRPYRDQNELTRCDVFLIVRFTQTLIIWSTHAETSGPSPWRSRQIGTSTSAFMVLAALLIPGRVTPRIHWHHPTSCLFYSTRLVIYRNCASCNIRKAIKHICPVHPIGQNPSLLLLLNILKCWVPDFRKICLLDKPRSIAMQTRACYLFLSLIMSLLLRNGAAFYEVSQKSTSADTTDLFLQRLHVGTIEKTASGSRLTSHSSVVSFRITDPQTDRSFIFKLSESQQQTLPHDSTSDWKIEVSVPRLPKPDAQSFCVGSYAQESDCWVTLERNPPISPPSARVPPSSHPSTLHLALKQNQTFLHTKLPLEYDVSATPIPFFCVFPPFLVCLILSLAFHQHWA
ncbi:hypothetical protein VP01_1422g3 [Puccinia sorghi]|uniref:Uncharacterized protein n=1 Tax=Puccinia sorghi TaxID=27349 RepID=A0A0L6VKQ5_9BASI|nr:hypothetical protein VP01_1422g3 [Puccinia sorghi]